MTADDCTCPKPEDDPDAYYPECEIHVDCDEHCMAQLAPQTLDELRAAVVHWRDHGLHYGCSHGC